MRGRTVGAVCSLLAAIILGRPVVGEPVPVAPPPRPGPPERVIAAGKGFATKGQVDLFVATTRTWNLPAEDDRLWEPALDLAWALVLNAVFGYWWPPHSSRKQWASVANYREWFHPRFIRVDEPYEQEKVLPTKEPRAALPGGIMAPGVSSPAALGHNIVVSRGDVRTARPIDCCLVFANGNVTPGTYLSESIVVCDGDVTVEQFAHSSLVVARGSIRIKGDTNSCTLIAGWKVTIARKVIRKQDFITIREDEPNALGFVTFFELSQIGVEAKEASGAVRVSSVADDKPCARAGVRAGDEVAAVNGKKPESAESLRRLLRDALAVGDATLTLRRGDKTETVKVALPD